MFECVTILFSDVVTFTEICSRISPMEVVSMLNAMYSIFDRLTEQNGVYKVSPFNCTRLYRCLLIKRTLFTSARWKQSATLTWRWAAPR